MKEREHRIREESATNYNNDMEVPAILTENIETEESEMRRTKNRLEHAENLVSIQAIFKKYPPVENAKYDDDCMDLCVPFSEAIDTKDYNKIMEDSSKRD